MAIGLPFVLNGQLENEDFLKASIQYCHWRSLLQSLKFKRGRAIAGDSIDGVASLEDLETAGTTLQLMMMQLKQTNEDDDEARLSCESCIFDMRHLSIVCDEICDDIDDMRFIFLMCTCSEYKIS